MLHYIYEQKIVIYAMEILLGIGFFIKLIQLIGYRYLIAASKNMGASEHRLMKQIRLHFDTCYKVKMSVHNVDSFVDKYVYTYKFCGISLYTFENIGGQILILMLLITLFGSIGAYYSNGGQALILSTFIWGACSAILLVAVDIFFGFAAKQKLLRVYMKDYLENYLKARLENEYFMPEEMEAYRKSYFHKEHEGGAEPPVTKENLQKRGQKEDEKIIEDILREYLV
ncbi:MAG: hypothetical protein PWP24_44 [Clostridiales bacterium]|nr:hypothetical protein [Clostridiales bacterium]